jgi:hypothetical protein
MPNFDRKGPRGEGSGTGRGMGRCGAKRDRSQGFRFQRFSSQKEEIKDLKSYQEDLNNELKAVKEKLKNDK